MGDPRQIVADNLARARDRIAIAADRAGRQASEIVLVAVTKYIDAATTAMVLDAGCIDLGEARPQDVWAKAANPQLTAARWHLVGQLQRNKVKRTVPLAELTHSVASERLLAAIDQEAVTNDLAPRVLLEVNCSGDSTKQGFPADELRRLLPTLADLRRVRVAGLMTMAASEGGELVARENFSALRKLRDELLSTSPPNVSLGELSMGMSGDFEAAIAEGATIVRVGSLLFEGLP